MKTRQSKPVRERKIKEKMFMDAFLLNICLRMLVLTFICSLFFLIGAQNKRQPNV